MPPTSLRLAAAAIAALVVLPAPTCVQPGLREAAAPCVRVGLTRETRQKFPHAAAALALLKWVLAKDELWPSGEGKPRPEVRRRIVTILEDKNLVIEYSEPLVPIEHLKGKPVVAAQTIDRNTIRLSAFAGNDLTALARTLLHELVHVEQLRYEGKPTGFIASFFTIEPLWELPAYRLEEALPTPPFAAPPSDVPCYEPPPAAPPGQTPSVGGSASQPCPPEVKTARLCPYAVKGAAAEPCPPGFCWDGGYNHSLACKQEEQKVPNAHPTDLNDLVCNDGFAKQVRDPCTKVLLRCE